MCIISFSRAVVCVCMFTKKPIVNYLIAFVVKNIGSLLAFVDNYFQLKPCINYVNLSLLSICDFSSSNCSKNSSKWKLLAICEDMHPIVNCIGKSVLNGHCIQY